MGRRRRTTRRELEKHLRIMRPDLADPVLAIVSGLVRVEGRIVTNPRSLVAHDASIVVRAPIVLRGETKLRTALAAFDVGVVGRTALDLGAAPGGFTRALLTAGADIDGAGDSVACHDHPLSLTRVQCHRGPGLNSESGGRNGDREALLRG
jgi:hypothetical protein